VHELALEARALTKRFGKVVALDGLDLQVERGESVALLGDAGGGKSTALRLFAGLARPSGGSVSVLGASPTGTGGLDARRRIGFVRQEPAFLDWLTGREQLSLAADLLGITGAAAGEQIDRALAHVGLLDAADGRVGSYSLAMRQRLELGQALIGDTELLLLDEPIGWLDAAGRGAVLELLRGLRGNATMVVATSDVALAESTCDRVAILDRGRLLATAPTIGLLDRVAPRDYVLETLPGPGLALAGLTARLSREPWVRGVASSDDVLRISVLDEGRAESELFATIASTGLAVRSLRREPPTIGVVVARLRGDRS